MIKFSLLRMYLQGPVYVGTGTMFRRFALYGFEPPKADKLSDKNPETHALKATDFDPDLDVNLLPKRFGNSTLLAESIPIAEFQGRPIADHPAVKYGRPPGVRMGWSFRTGIHCLSLQR